ncbi:MAG: hypothetical protein WBO44_01845 [Saprospiraceae bacterium]
MNISIKILLVTCVLFSSKLFGTVKLCHLVTRQCKIVYGSCDDWADVCNSGPITCESLKKTPGKPGGGIQCYKNAKGIAYLVYNGSKFEIASDQYINDIKAGKFNEDPKKYAKDVSSTKVINEICKEYNIKMEVKENIGM